MKEYWRQNVGIQGPFLHSGERPCRGSESEWETLLLNNI